MDMVERVAKAIEAAGAMLITLDAGGTEASIFDYITDDDIQILARAAIEAMREPTDAMVNGVYIGEQTDYEITRIWRDMIDAALKKV